jgi:NADH:ubiquinone oxidoreductase subunit H
LMKVGWKVLLPTGLVVLIATAIAGLLPEIESAVVGVLR